MKFTAEGGQVTLRAGRVPRAEVGRLSGAWPGRSFPLADNDVRRVSRDQRHRQRHRHLAGGLEQLFKPFSQIDSGLARKFEGTGLGLAMVKLLAELHGGAVAVESAVGEGSCFTVWLPLRTPDEDGAAAPVKRADVAPSRPRPDARIALVVEDDFKSAELIRVQLEAEGFTVLHAASAEAALALAVQQPLSLITLDIMLPDMDGWEFLGRLKQMPDAAAHPGRDHLDRRRPQQGLRARRRGGHAEADLAAGAVRVAGRPRPVSAVARRRRSRCWSSTTIPRRWS